MSPDRRRPARVPGALVALVALASSAACTDSVDDGAGGDDRPVTTSTPRPAALDEPVAAGGVEVVVRAAEPYTRSPDAFPRLRLIMRSRNVGDHDATNPEVGLFCDESDEVGEWHLGSTWEAAGFLPEGSVSEGELLVAFPSKPGDRFYPLASCTDPRIRVTIDVDDAGAEVFDVALDSALIDAALVEPLGARFPLPTVAS